MGLCDLKSDNVLWTIATYFLALLPWSILTLVDPISDQWLPYWMVFLSSVLYLFVSILPYFVLLPYSILQGCSKHGTDIKELLTAVVAMVASLWNLHRALRGLLALYDCYLIWNDISFSYINHVFKQWMPQVVYNGQVVCIDDRHKCSIWNVLVSNAIVENDWPGSAPRIPYIFSFVGAIFGRHLQPGKDFSIPLSVENYDNMGEGGHLFRQQFRERVRRNVYAVDKTARLSMFAVWTLWMVRRSIAKSFSYKEDHNDEVHFSGKVYSWGSKRNGVSKEDALHLKTYYGDGNRIVKSIDRALWRRHQKDTLPDAVCSIQKPLTGHDVLTKLNNIGLRRVLVIHEATLERSSGMKQEAALNNEIEMRLDSLPIPTKYDFAPATVDDIAELYLHLYSWKGPNTQYMRTCCFGFSLPREYQEILFQWIKTRNIGEEINSSKYGSLLAYIILVMMPNERMERALMWHGVSSLYPSLPVPLKSASEALLLNTGRFIGLMHDVMKPGAIQRILKSISHATTLEFYSNADSLRRKFGNLLKDVLGENWDHPRNIRAWSAITMETMESLNSVVEQTSMPKVPGDDFSTNVSYHLLPSEVFFCLQEHSKCQIHANLRRIVAKEAQFESQDCWVESNEGSMVLDDSSIQNVTMNFQSVSPGTYAMGVLFKLRQNGIKFTVDNCITLTISVQGRQETKINIRKWFETEPIGVGKDKGDHADILASHENKWMCLHCFNVQVEQQNCDIIAEVSCNSAKYDIALKAFEIRPMMASDRELEASCKRRSGRKCVLHLAPRESFEGATLP